MKQQSTFFECRTILTAITFAEQMLTNHNAGTRFFTLLSIKIKGYFKHYSPVNDREYVDERGSYVMRQEMSGVGVAPFSHQHNSTAVLIGDELYAGTVADFTGKI